MTEAEFTKLIEDLRPELVRIAGRRCGRDQADDAVQTAVLHCWKDGGWASAPQTTVAGWLRRLARMRARDELRGLGRLRAAQKNIAVLANSGGKRLAPKGGADKQSDEIQRTAQRRQEAGQ